MKFTKIVCKYLCVYRVDYTYVAIERVDGMRPYGVSALDAHEFISVEEAEKYVEMFREEDLKVVKLVYEVTEELV
jgi:hypothetical protein